MEDMIHYLDGFVEPTIEEFARNPASIRHAFLACVVTFHSVDYLAYDKAGRKTRKGKVGNLRSIFGNLSSDFKLVDDVAHAFKHVVSGNARNPNLRSEEVVSQAGAFSSDFSSDFGQGADLLETRGWDDLACGVIVA